MNEAELDHAIYNRIFTQCKIVGDILYGQQNGTKLVDQNCFFDVKNK